jgi:glucan 1,3-beta-glucosidase
MACSGGAGGAPKRNDKLLTFRRWITPSLYTAAGPSVIDEWTFTQTLGKVEALKRLKNHWNTWVTLADFQKIQKAGFNVVRIPIGYWAYADFGGQYVQGSAPYMDNAITWARQTGLKIIIDLHGAPKSQNGWEHSGHTLPRPGWGDAQSVAWTLQVLTSISKYAKPQYQDVVVAIELLNEPLLSSLDPNTVRNFYTSGHNLIRRVSDTPVLLHDGFWDPAYWNGFLSWPAAYNVILDHHEYQVFDSYLNSMSLAQHRSQVCFSTKAFADTDKLQVVGEWSAALTDCAPWVNGRFTGHRFDGSFPGSWHIGSCAGRGDVRTWSQAIKNDYRMYIEAQMDSYEAKTQGWIFWNFKTEGGADEWDLFKLLGAGVFPQPLIARAFPRNVCR